MKKIICVVLAFAFMACMFLSVSAYSCEYDSSLEFLATSASTEEGEVFSDKDFKDDTVLIVLTLDASENNPILTPDDFAELGVIEVDRLSSDGAKQHIYTLTLNKHDKQNVLDVISELEKIEWIYSAEPNFSTSSNDNKVEVTDELLNAISSYEEISVNKEDVCLEYMFMLATNKYVVRYTLNGESYSGDVVKVKFGEFLLTTSRPVPLVYKDGILYDFEDAYNKGCLNKFDMHALMSYERINIKTLEDVAGDADMDGELSILDATHAQMYIAGLINESAIDLNASDMDLDGEVSILDATEIQLKLAGLI